MRLSVLHPIFRISILFWVGQLGVACSSSEQSPRHTDTYNQGRVAIVVDETVRPVVEQLIDSFEHDYPNAQIDAYFLPERECLKRFLDPADTVRLFIGGRKLSEAEEATFRNQRITPDYTKVAIDGVVAIVNRSNPDTLLARNFLLDILTGRAQRWSEFGNQRPGNRDSIVIVFESGNSSTRSFLADSFLTAENPITNRRVYAADSALGVVRYVAENPNAIGFIGFNWISDGRVQRVQQAYSQVQVARLQNRNPELSNHYPNLLKNPQYYLATRQYLLRRTIYMVKREAHRGLGTGFESFVAGRPGQMIVHQMNLQAPFLPYEFRVVELEEGDLRQQDSE